MTDLKGFGLLRNIFLLFLTLHLGGCSTSSSFKETSKPSDHEKPAVFYDQKMPVDEGMWLLPQVTGAVYNQMQSKGLQLSPNTIYHPDSTSLNRSIARINIGESSAGTGSFVSSKGLILTNHHVAFDAIAGTNSDRPSHLEKGFYAKTQQEEIPLPNYSLYITLEQKEVTEQINRKLSDTLTNRENYIQGQKIRKQLIQQRKGDNNNLIVQINDFWGGNRQFMSVYRVIRDVRLVYAPPKSIGKFGGNDDNWEWPRHTGDIAFLRAYVGPDGNSKSFSDSNVPFQPAKKLSLSPQGVAPGDFTMVMGYPGQTFRNESSYAHEFYYKHRNPILIEIYQSMLYALNYAAQENGEQARESAAKRAALANNIKYYRGIQRGIEKHNIIEKKRAIEKEFLNWMQEDSLRFIKYRRVLNQLDQAYNIAGQTGDLLYGVVNTLNNSRLLQIAGLYSSYDTYLSDSTNTDLSEADKDSLLSQHKRILNTINVEAQKRMLKGMLHSLATLPEGKVIFHLMKLFKGTQGKALENKIDKYLKKQQQESIIFDINKAKKFLDLPVDSARKLQADQMVTLYQEILDSYHFSKKNYIQHIPYLRPAHERYVQGMLAFRSDSIAYPDANSTLRISAGRVHGYSAKDGILNMPFTSFKGMLAKDTDKPPFDVPEKLEVYSDSTGRIGFNANTFTTPGGTQLVNFLTTNDITGGSSGSPVLNSEGELVGLAFDSNIEGVVSDYHFIPSVTRAINVDIRYILFLMQKFSNTDRLLREMNIGIKSFEKRQQKSGGT